MKACIYQKQDPVNIPQTETRVLTDVLNLPWGVEIYDLLIRWNPLRARQWLPKPYTGLKALVLGMGPAGFTLSHHLLMEGFAVVGADGLKIEPLPSALLDEPVRDFDMLTQSLDERTMSGFGGVAEYGITNRWDKNFLRVIYLSLARRAHFQVFGGVRFGGTLTVENAWALGFDHIAICIGAGLPQALPIPGSLAPGMRQANDFLMALQLSGAAKRDSLANLQVRLPAVVVGGGLTGIDAATEVQAYYLVQIEKLLARYEALVKADSEDAVRAGLDAASLTVLDEMLAHARLVRAERVRAAACGRAPDLQKLLQSWGGVTVAYRRGMKDSPAYTRNHEEIIKAFEEGIYYAEGLDPKVAKLDASGHVESLVCRQAVKGEDGKWIDSGKDVVLPARSVLVATGARPNVAYEFEHRGHFTKDGAYYQSFRESDGVLTPAPVTRHGKTDDFGAFTSYQQDGRRISYLGDTHPVFNGSVVRAVASAQRTYPKIVAALGERTRAQGDTQEYQAFRRRMHDALSAQVLDVTRHTPTVVEITVRAPLAAQRFAPGQFFRVQTFETHATVVEGTRLQTETVALYGSKVDVEAGTVSLIVIERGASTRLFSTLRAGDPIVLMGPTGVKTTIPEQPETFLFVGDALAAAQVRCVGPALRAAGHRVLLALEFDTAADHFCQDDLEAASDSVLWVTKQGESFKPRRATDRAAPGDMVEALAAYAKGELTGGSGPIRLEDVSKVLIVGTSCLVRHMRDARRDKLAPYLVKKPATTGSISTPVQCGLKGVCSQCLQWQVDPANGQRTKAVFGCSWQDQPIDLVDMDNLDERLGQNRLLEHLSALWLNHLLDKHKIERV
jgi:NADPH-dependent glutamate synthase beta subunit-like oxidoreductase/NADPH-dependent ferric siderophore reductase